MTGDPPDAAGSRAAHRVDASADATDPTDPTEPTEPIEPVEPGEASEADAAAPQGPADEKGSAARRPRVRRLAGVVAFGYVVWSVLGLVLLDRDPSAYNALNRGTGNLVARLVLAGVLLALVFHLVDGLRVALIDLVPRFRRHDLGLRTIASFLVPALWIPATVVLLWPAVRGWFSW